MPSYNDAMLQQRAKQYADDAQKYIPKTTDFGPVEAEIYKNAAQRGIDFSKTGTQANIANQNLVTPGSQEQRQLAQNQINQYIQGQIPQDVQQNIQRQVAQNLGGGFNAFSGGGQAPSAFARNIGQTSVGLSQFGLSAAPTWQQLANSMVVSPSTGMSASLQSRGIANSQIFGTSELGMKAANLGLSSIGLGIQGAENAYQSGVNQYQADQLQKQQTQQMIMQGASSGLDLYKSSMKGDYLNNLNPSGRGLLATLGGLPSAGSASSYMSNLGYNPSAMSAVPNTGAGTAYPFG
jgi:hypothetical protein